MLRLSIHACTLQRPLLQAALSPQVSGATPDNKMVSLLSERWEVLLKGLLSLSSSLSTGGCRRAPPFSAHCFPHAEAGPMVRWHCCTLSTLEPDAEGTAFHTQFWHHYCSRGILPCSLTALTKQRQAVLSNTVAHSLNDDGLLVVPAALHKRLPMLTCGLSGLAVLALTQGGGLYGCSSTELVRTVNGGSFHPRALVRSCWALRAGIRTGTQALQSMREVFRRLRESVLAVMTAALPRACDRFCCLSSQDLS